MASKAFSYHFNMFTVYHGTARSRHNSQFKALWRGDLEASDPVTTLPPLAVITNRGSTRNLRGDAWVDPLLAGEAGVTHHKVDAGDIAAAVAACARDGAETIVVNGGDGTVGLVFAALLNSSASARLPALALLPAGKTNMTGADWSLRGSPEAALTAVLRARREGTLAQHVITRPVLTLRQSAEAPPLYGAFFGAAEVVDGIRFCRKHIYPLKMPNAFSHAAAIGVLLTRALFGGGGQMAVENEAQAIESGTFFAVIVTALDEMLLGIRAEHGAMTSAPLSYISLRPGLGAMRAGLGALLRKRIAAGAGRTVERFARVSLAFTGAYTLDGELYEADAAQPLVLEGNRTLDFIRLPA